MNDARLVFLTARLALAVASVVTSTSTTALGACNAALCGELVPSDRPNQLHRQVPQTLLVFSLHEIMEENGYTVQKVFQPFSFSNDEMTLPIPFVLNISSPRDCPKDLDMWVTGSHHGGFHYEYPMQGQKKINLENIELTSVMVYSPSF